ncbi:SCO1/SenC-domain-containing protein [Ampelomyces quisqualis]|uniref:SCO1/SenC-domain-containing protein n=1 Tax=Ampelomyces quisqualis TaxID=50730 RepID=A0A6A5QFE6_AMPQU|nr:SCO1/SenC-domain-containing protein [Ampelomyces quisqualis]
MSAPCRISAGVARTIGTTAAPRIARRTFALHSANLTSASPLTTRGGPICLRESQGSSIRAGELASPSRGPTRSFTQSASRSKLNTIDQIRARNRGGPFNLTAAVLFVVSGSGLWIYFRYEKERVARKRIADQTKGVGKPKVGGPFKLVDQEGNSFSSDDMLGKYSLVYFGFTHCPDICPDELDKMALMYDKVVERCGKVLLPIMITCDPARDNPKVLKEYLKEFHPEFIGLTGDYDQIKNTCKAYRVYFSTPTTVKPGEDYLVDHSIYFYLMDPEGDFVEAIGRNFTADQAAKIMVDHIKDWEKPLKKAERWS